MEERHQRALLLDPLADELVAEVGLRQEGYRSARKKALKADARYGQGLDKLTPLYRAKGYPVGSGSEEILCPGG
ncbi:MAG: hypothetical protein ACR2ML_01875 [Solirubrobacteraceae bacterium]